MVTDSTEANPTNSVEYEYFVRARDADACLNLIRSDLRRSDPGRQRILSIGLEETDSPHVPFPDGDGIVHRRGPIEMIKVQQRSLKDRIKRWIGANKASDTTSEPAPSAGSSSHGS